MSTRAPTAPDWLDVPADVFVEGFGTAPFRFRHRLDCIHPLLTREELAARADDWPTRWVEHHRADLPLVLLTGETDQLGLSAGDVVRGIDGNGCWLVLWDLQHSPSYEDLLDQCLAPVHALVGGREGGVTSSGMNLLVSSPCAVVPAHFDLHHNFLLQVAGTKEIMIGSFSDPTIAAREVNRYFDERNNNASLLPDVVTTFTLAPGDGVYIPPYAFHWVRGGSEASVGVSCGFRTGLTERTDLVHMCNARLRRLGLRTVPPGRSAQRDRLKAAAFVSWRRVRRAAAPVTSRARRLMRRSR